MGRPAKDSKPATSIYANTLAKKYTANSIIRSVRVTTYQCGKFLNIMQR